MITVYVPIDAAAIAVGANKVAKALAARAGDGVTIKRNGSRGMQWLEPMVEVVTRGAAIRGGGIHQEGGPGSMGIDASTLVLETTRLRLRHLEPGDLAPLAEIQADPEVMRYFTSGPRTRRGGPRRSWSGASGLQARHGFSLWAAVDRADGRLVGRCGLLPQSLQGREEVEIAYLIGRPHWNLGLGTEAARAIRDHGFDALGLDAAGLDHPPRQPGLPARRREGRPAPRAVDPVHEPPLLALRDRIEGPAEMISLRSAAVPKGTSFAPVAVGPSQGEPARDSPAGSLEGLDPASLYILASSFCLATMGAMTHAVGPRCDWLVVSLVRALVMLATSAALARSSRLGAGRLAAQDALGPQPRRARAAWSATSTR